MNKKLMSSVLAGAMAVSTLSVAASAATSEKVVKAAGSTTYKVSATVAEAEINVSVPGAMSAVVNPYGIEIMMKGEKYGAQGFTSAYYTIKNNTLTSAVKVSATPTIVVPTVTNADKSKSPTIAVLDKAADITAKETAKEKAIYAYVAGLGTNVDGTDNVATTATTIPQLAIFDASGALNSGVKSAVFEDATLDAKGATHTKTDLMIVPKATDKGDGTVDKYGYGQIVMGGDVTNTNVTPWSKSDKLTVNLVLDIAPCADDAVLGTSSGSVDPTPAARVTAATATANGTAIAAGDISVNATAKTIAITSGATAGNPVAVTLTLDTGCTLGTVTATDSTKFAGPTASGNVVTGTFIAVGGGFTVLVNDGTDDETWTVTIN